MILAYLPVKSPEKRTEILVLNTLDHVLNCKPGQQNYR